jgi:hypothetical protein
MDRCCYCRLPFNVGQQWQEVANDAVRVVFTPRATPHGVLTGKRRRNRRWGSKAEAFRRSRRMRGADVARVARRRRWSRIFTRHTCRRRGLRRHALDSVPPAHLNQNVEVERGREGGASHNEDRRSRAPRAPARPSISHQGLVWANVGDAAGSRKAFPQTLWLRPNNSLRPLKSQTLS